ncbi:MAG: hypothetical protein QXL94_00880 [Candidatus Parvarchaeum sp.]
MVKKVEFYDRCDKYRIIVFEDGNLYEQIGDELVEIKKNIYNKDLSVGCIVLNNCLYFCTQEDPLYKYDPVAANLKRIERNI